MKTNNYGKDFRRNKGTVILLSTVYREEINGNVLILGAGRNDIVYAAGVNRRNEILLNWSSIIAQGAFLMTFM